VSAQTKCGQRNWFIKRLPIETTRAKRAERFGKKVRGKGAASAWR
jgi:hypothetical protein